VVLLVDIHSGLNTSDELDIVRFITNKTKREWTTNGNEIYTLVVVNKADDMQLSEDGDGTTLEITGELNEMFQQVQTTIEDEFEKMGLSDHIIGIIPLCAVDAYLYRMVMKHQRNFELTPEQILKIGVNENGKKFSTYKPNVQRDKVYEILKDQTFIDTMIKLSGFAKFESVLHEFLNGTNKVGSELRISNIMAKINKFPRVYYTLIDDGINCYDQGLVIPKSITNLISKYIEHYKLIKPIDNVVYSELITQCFTEISDAISHNVKKMDDPTQILTYYDQMKISILQTYFGGGGMEYTYPAYVKEQVIQVCLGIISRCNTDIIVINDIFTNLNKVGVYEKAFEIMSTIIKLDDSSHNILCKKATMLDYVNMVFHITELNKIKGKEYTIIISQFIRVLLISKYNTSTVKNVHWNAYMLFQKNRELIMSAYLESIVNNNPKLNYRNYINGIDTTFEIGEDAILDMFYLEYELTNHPHNFINKKRHTKG
jgi:hypothetical protein